ncbi:c-type cytochrome [Rhodovulum sp. P5]|uniref:c-type cytochrome n=1 Tax=Rhodovulum sp. P5 TaxID=1564506 RepID=UPI0009D929EF|nr:c-type cytochrome [Rhodovulum sp. P5]
MRGGILFSLVLTLGGVGQGIAQSGPEEIGDPERGADVWIFCSGCHQIGPDAETGIGPPLNGIFGRRAAAIEGFPYSKSMRRMGNDGLTWTLETLDAYLENPRVLVSGTRMSFDGLEDAGERADLLAYLRVYSDRPSNIPEAAPTARPDYPHLPAETLAIVGDAAYGEYLASECQTCHQSDGSDRGIPSITLWPEEDFVLAMHAYKQRLRPHPVMQMMASRLSDEEIAALAAYFGTLSR